MKQRICAILCSASFMLATTFGLASCNLEASPGIVDAEINDDGELILIYENGREQNLGIVVGEDGEDGRDGSDSVGSSDGNDSSIVITSQGSSIPAASSKGLRSAVSIVCKFQTTVQQGGWRPGGSGGTTTRDYSSAGSGVIYRLDKSKGDAFVITNYHVVYDTSSNTTNGISDDICVYLYGSELEGKAIKASYVGGSLYYDIAVLYVENSDILKESNACSVDFADSDRVIVGDSAIAIGNAQGYGISASLGVISVDSEYITMTAADERTRVSFRVIRVDTAVNSGNSGGGLYDDEGNLIGIVNAKIVDEGVENIGYAIPSNIVRSVAENILDYCYGTDTECVQKALLGITVTALDSKMVYDQQTGLLSIAETVGIYEISEGSLADGVLQTGDVLLSATINEGTIEITRQFQAIELMLDVRVGDTVGFTVLRDGIQKTVSITITEGCLTAY